MTIKPNNWYTGKTIGDFKVLKIRKIENQPVFDVENVHSGRFSLSLEEMKAETPKVVK